VDDCHKSSAGVKVVCGAGALVVAQFMFFAVGLEPFKSEAVASWRTIDQDGLPLMLVP
jgi:hypothetical protein